MSMMGEFIFFLSLQIKKCEQVMFLNQSKYIANLLKSFDTPNAKPFGTTMSPSIKFDLDPNSKKVYMTLF